MTYRQEIYRKLIHIASLGIPLSYYFLFDRMTMLWALGISTIILLVSEGLRLYFSFFQKIFQKIFGKVVREQELNTITGASYTLMGSFFAILFFEKWVAVYALMVLALSDSLAALVGIKWKKFPLLSKSIPGTITFLIVALILVFLIPNLPKVGGICSAFIATVVELLPSPINDNLLIPLTVGISISMVNLIL